MLQFANFTEEVIEWERNKSYVCSCQGNFPSHVVQLTAKKKERNRIIHPTLLHKSRNALFKSIYHYLPQVTIVDLRSDTVTKPTLRMREAMRNADVGDDVYMEDPTVKKLEKTAASLLGMEAGIFVTSGTMGNLIAIMNHCDVRGCEAYCGEESHTLLHEQCGASQIAGVNLSPLKNQPDGTFDINVLSTKLRRDRDHEPISKLVLVENTINGKIVPQQWIDELVKFCKKEDLKLHLDGARLWNAVAGSKRTAKEIVTGFDSVTFCLSKGLGAPVGSVLCGTKDFILKSRRIRKVLGGGMRQVGVLAAAGLIALEDSIPILLEDHARAQLLAKSIDDLQSKVFRVDMQTVQTNMVFVNVDCNVLKAADFVARLNQINTDDEDDKTVVNCLALSDSLARFVIHYDINDELLHKGIRKIKLVIKGMDRNV